MQDALKLNSVHMHMLFFRLCLICALDSTRQPKFRSRKTAFTKKLCNIGMYLDSSARAKYRLRHVVKTGAVCAVDYPTVVGGVDDVELAKIRRSNMRFHNPSHGGASLTCKVALNGDPVLALGLSPALLYHKKVVASHH